MASVLNFILVFVESGVEALVFVNVPVFSCRVNLIQLSVCEFGVW